MSKAMNQLREFVNNNQLHIPKRYANTTYEEFKTKEFIFNSNRSGLNFALDIVGMHKTLQFIWTRNQQGKTIIKFKEKDNE